MEYSLHKIESVGSTSTANAPIHHQDTTEIYSANASEQLRKRSAACISSTHPKSQPFLSSYGSAFLSGIFADIAQAGEEDAPDGADPAAPSPAALSIENDDIDAQEAASEEPLYKKARTTASTSFGRQPKSYMALTGLVEGADSEVIPSPSVVSPRPNTSTVQIQPFNAQVRQLQDMAFPTLPHIPMTVSSSSCSTASQNPFSPLGEGGAQYVQDGPSYGWFVATDGDEEADENEPSSAFMFLPDIKPDLAFKALTAPSAGDQDLEVQQALAADTIDDVLGDLF
jgi:hypothetical protein